MGNNRSVTICFFEDEKSIQLQPLILTRPVDDLRVGLFTVREKWMKDLAADNYLRSEREVFGKLFETAGEPAKTVYWVNSRLLPDPAIIDQAQSLDKGELICAADTMLLIKTDHETTEMWLQDGIATDELRLQESADAPKLLNELWDLIALNRDEIDRDIARHSELPRLTSDGENGIRKLGDHPVYTASDSIIEPNVTFETSDGPVYIGPQAKVMAGSHLRGPVAICEQSTVKMGAKIYGNTTVGPVCKVAGEVENSIFHSYSNKSHDGFVGNSIFGQWCNLGADTNTSNLKNNYSSVTFTNWASGEKQDTGEQFLGTVMGDHSKTAINTMLNTGTNCGVSCNLFGHGFPPTFIRSFSWVGPDETVPYRFDKAVKTMERVMKRRDVEMTDDYVKMMKDIFENR